MRIIWKVAFVWALGWLVTYPALNADMASIGAPNNCEFVRSEARKTLSTSMLFAMLPATWIAAPFLTGFYEHGMQFGTAQKDCGQ